MMAHRTGAIHDLSWYTEYQLGRYLCLQHLFECPLSLMNYLEDDMRGMLI